MLILTRKVGESIAIGDEVVIKILDVRGKQVRLGVQAPAYTSVHRKEIYERIQKENKEAAKAVPADLSMAATMLKLDRKAKATRDDL